MNKIFDCLIIGSGPTGMGASLKLKEAGKDIAIIEKDAPGGKVNIAPRVDNYPGFKQIPGPDLAYEFYKRMKQADIQIIGDEVTSLEKYDSHFKLVCSHDVLYAKTILIASGTLERKLGLDKEDEMLGHGLSYCALCDGHFFRNKNILVAGGGNSALKEAIYLSNLANHLTLIHRRNQFRGSDKLVEELKSKSNVTILTPFIPVEIMADDHITGIKIRNVEDNKEQVIDVDGFFPLVGQIPNTKFINIDGIKDEWGTIPVDRTMMTGVPGVFAGGDCLPRDIKQIYLSEHDGMVAAKSIIEYLSK